MPSFTLLGDDVIRYVTAGAKATGKIPPGYLDHEYVHGWFGNGLFVDPNDGNWCEALTSYFSNYYAKELESPQAGLDARRAILEHYAIRVSPALDVPVWVDGKPAGSLHLEGKSGVFRATLDAEPKVVELDPGYDVLRRIADADLPACLNRTLASVPGVVTWTGADSVFRPLAER